MRIGIFDTGMGGVLVAERLRRMLPGHEYLVVDDKQFMPYGSRSQMAIAHLTDRAIQPLLVNKCDVIVLACNTATAAAIEYLRARYPAQTFVGFEPMVKPAASLSHAKRISVLATPATLKSDRYRSLIKRHAADVAIHQPDTSRWAQAIEDGMEPDNFTDVIDDIVTHGSDVVILACTHYLALQEAIQAKCGVRVIEPTASVARRIADITAATQPRRIVLRDRRSL